MSDETPNGDRGEPLFTFTPDRGAEARGELMCYRCGAVAEWYPWADAWLPACTEHAPEDDWA